MRVQIRGLCCRTAQPMGWFRRPNATVPGRSILPQSRERKLPCVRDCKFLHLLAACKPSFRAGCGLTEIFALTSMADMRRINRRCYPLPPLNLDPTCLCCLRLLFPTSQRCSMTLRRISTTMKQRFCRNFAMCSGLALLFLAMISASAQQVQRNPIVVHATAHTTTPLAFRDMTPVPWHNASKVMPEHDRAPYPHISSMPDSVTQSLTLPLVSTS